MKGGLDGRRGDVATKEVKRPEKSLEQQKIQLEGCKAIVEKVLTEEK